jgi:hypothetical protein
LLHCSRLRPARRIAASLTVAALAIVTNGCSDRNNDVEKLRAAAVEVLDELNVTVTRPPSEQHSKDIRYVTADGSSAGDTASVAEHVASTLADQGWQIKTSEPSGAPTDADRPADTIIATRDDIVLRILIAGKLGTNTAPAGAQLIQLAAAFPDDRLAWTR